MASHLNTRLCTEDEVVEGTSYISLIFGGCFALSLGFRKEVTWIAIRIVQKIVRKVSWTVTRITLTAIYLPLGLR